MKNYSKSGEIVSSAMSSKAGKAAIASVSLLSFLTGCSMGGSSEPKIVGSIAPVPCTVDPNASVSLSMDVIENPDQTAQANQIFLQMAKTMCGTAATIAEAVVRDFEETGSSNHNLELQQSGDGTNYTLEVLTKVPDTEIVTQDISATFSETQNETPDLSRLVSASYSGWEAQTDKNNNMTGYKTSGITFFNGGNTQGWYAVTDTDVKGDMALNTSVPQVMGMNISQLKDEQILLDSWAGLAADMVNS